MKTLNMIAQIYFCFLVLLFVVTKSVFGFNIALPTTIRTFEHCLSSKRYRSNVQLSAKPPPISNFDLEAIEAFENQIDLLQQDEMNSIANNNRLDTDGLSLLEEDDIDSDDAVENVRIYTVPEEMDGKRIDAVLAALEPSLSRSVCGNLVSDGFVRQISTDTEELNGVLLDRKSYKVDAGTILRVVLPKDNLPTEIAAQNIPLNIVFEDEHMIVLNKGAGMVVHPAAGNWDGTVVNALAYYLANKSPHGPGDFVDSNGKVIYKTDEKQNDDPAGADGETVSFRPGIVHRLDKGTTGILVVAKATHALSKLSEAFAARKVKKTYLAVTVGNPGKHVVIDKPIGRHPIQRQRMRVVPDPHKKDSSGRAPKDRIKMSTTSSSLSQSGRRALSYVDTLSFDGKLSLVQVRIETGRTHQIRVHLQDRHTPIYGDEIYGIADWNKRLAKTHNIQRPLLHAYKIELDHPITGEKMIFKAPMAEDMAKISLSVWPEGCQELPNAFPV